MLVVGAAAAVIAFVVSTGPSRPIPQPVFEPLPLASGSEVEIVRIDGDDVASVVVGRLPLVGVLELANAGDVELTQANERMPMVQAEGRRPMLWAKLESEQ